jgi:8-oxo-dGTP pyrophosphatase MutT (NUDIX family)
MPIVSESGESVDEAFGVIPILRRGDAVLFLVIQHNAGHWAFPKGHAERDEDHAAAALRELFEETGIRDVVLDHSRIFVEQYVKTTRSSARVIRKTVRYFLGAVADPAVRLQPEEIRDHRWATLDEARKLITYAESRRMLDEAAQAIGIV